MYDNNQSLSNTTMSSHEFPADLIPDILSRLPVKTLSKFQFISKLWSSIIEDRKFRLMHANSSPVSQICLCASHGGKNAVYKIYEIKDDGVMKEFCPLPDEIQDNHAIHVAVVGSSNGVLCLLLRNIQSLEFGPNKVILWNPLSKKFRYLPPLPPSEGLQWPCPDSPYYRSHYCTCGFGYDEVKDDYKVLLFLISVQHGPKDHALVYSLKSNTWRSIDKFPIPSEGVEAGVLFRGALHSMSRGTHPSLISFDLSTEEFKTFSAPPVGVPGPLGISVSLRKKHTLLKWYFNNFEIVFSLEPQNGDTYRCLKPVAIAIVKSPDPVLMFFQEGLSTECPLFYDLETKSVINGKASRMSVNFFREVFPYIQTLEFY